MKENILKIKNVLIVVAMITSSSLNQKFIEAITIRQGLTLNAKSEDTLNVKSSADDDSTCSDGSSPVPSQHSTDSYWSGTSPYCNGKCTDCTDNGYLCAGEFSDNIDGSPDYNLASKYAAKLYDVSIDPMPEYGADCLSISTLADYCSGCSGAKALCYKVTSTEVIPGVTNKCVIKKTSDASFEGTSPFCGGEESDCTKIGYLYCGVFGGPNTNLNEEYAQAYCHYHKSVLIDPIPSFGSDCNGWAGGKALCYKLPECVTKDGTCTEDSDCCSGYGCRAKFSSTGRKYSCVKSIKIYILAGSEGCVEGSTTADEPSLCFDKGYYSMSSTYSIYNSTSGGWYLNLPGIVSNLETIYNVAIELPVSTPCETYAKNQQFSICSSVSWI